MSAHVGHLTTEVVPEPEPPVAAGTPESGGWEKEDRGREEAERRRRIAWRTRAEGFDD